jgi:hypothetical protein
MGNARDRLVGYCSRLVSGLVVCAVVATTLRAEVAAVTIVSAIMLVVLAVAGRMFRDDIL